MLALWLQYTMILASLCLCVVDTAVCRTQTKQPHSRCGRRNGLTLLSRLLKCLQIIATRIKEGLVNATLHHKYLCGNVIQSVSI